MGLVARKPVFGVSDKASFKPVSSDTETSLKTEISLIVSLDMILLDDADQAARMRRLVCACVVRKPSKTGFFRVKAQIESNIRTPVLLNLLNKT